MGCTFSKKAIDSIKTMPPLENSWLEQKKMYVALYDYKARDKNDMSFKEQDQLEILDDTGVRKRKLLQQNYRLCFFAGKLVSCQEL
jgi:hypothetical protein